MRAFSFVCFKAKTLQLQQQRHWRLLSTTLSSSSSSAAAVCGNNSRATADHQLSHYRLLAIPRAAAATTRTGSLLLLNAAQQQQQRWHGGGGATTNTNTSITVTFLQPDGETRTPVQAFVGETLLQTAHRNEIDLEGACEGVCACSTCHLILPPSLYDALPEPSEDEEDMLDMAFGLTETSRLGCQITVTADMDGVVLEMPKATRNFYVDGHTPKPH